MNNHTAGVAYTFPKKEHCGHGSFNGRKPLVGTKVSEIIPCLGVANLVSSSLAMAAHNVLLMARELTQMVTSGDILANLDIRNGDQTCMVGYFLPLIPALKKRGAQVLTPTMRNCS